MCSRKKNVYSKHNPKQNAPPFWITQKVAKAGTGLMNVDQQEIYKVTLCQEHKVLEPMPNLVQSFSAIIKKKFFSDQLKNIMPILRSHTVLDNRTTIEERTKFQKKP